MSTSPKRLAVLASAAVVTAGLTVLAPPVLANPAGTGLVISEVYGAGGNSGAVYNADFVELYNPTAEPVDLLGKYVSYRTSTSSFVNGMSLRGVLQPGDHYLVRMSSTGANGAALPTPDRVASPAISMATEGGQVFLTQGYAPPVTGFGNIAGTDRVIDMVGLDPNTSNAYEGTPAPAATTTQSANRAGAGTDTDTNGADFSLAAPSPSACGCVPATGTASGSIAKIQGTGDTSPYLDDTVTTRGVVTAVYPTGGFNGFFMQTSGTGGVDATPGASDAIFVFGSNAMAANPAIGDLVEVTGVLTEFAGETQITPGAGGVTKPADPSVTPVAQTSLPFAGCSLGSCPSSAVLERAREAHEGELYQPAGPATVTNAFPITNGANAFMEIGVAFDTQPLIAPTEVEDAQTGATTARGNYNAARLITLDDGSSSNYNGSASSTPMPWIDQTHYVRVGAPTTFTGPVALDFRNNSWKVQPVGQVTDLGTGTATFGQNRPAAQPDDVGGDLKLATFNVLNYFNTTGEAWVAGGAGRSCSYFSDRQGNRVTVNSCTPDGPRGAAQADDLQRQQDKIVTAINALDSDIVSLEEIENSVKLGESDRDDAVSALVSALNTAAGTERWAFVASPPAAQLPALAEQDVIRTAFIYDPSTVQPVGPSKVLVGSAPFNNAREPLAQVFKPKDGSYSQAFGVIVNHFKSKGDSVPPATGDNANGIQGAFNGDRVRQAQALVTFANSFKAQKGVSKLYLTGDFNSYSEEDPVQVLEAAGYTGIESDTAGEETYNFSGLNGSLDHVFANDAGLADVEGADVWNINSPESLAYQYSRFNYNITQFFDGTIPYAASDHDPEIVGINTPKKPIKVQILGTNDFHGRIANDPNSAAAGAAVMAGAVKQFKEANPDTVFAAAGDLIGASTFESFIDKDKPTIDALNSAGLDVSSAGNHEFDQGYHDLIDRVMAPYDPITNPKGGAAWQYIAANLKLKSNPTIDALTPSWTTTLDGVEVGFVGAVTEHLPELVSPAGISEIQVEDIVTSVNEEADQLKADGADIVVMLVHEGAGGTDCAAMDDDPSSDFGSIVTGIDANVDAIVSGHTHLEYNCDFTVPQWVTEGRPVTKRPVVSAGQYGAALNQIVFDVDPVTHDVIAKQQAVLKLKVANGGPFNYPVDAPTQTIVDTAVANATVLGAVPLGQIGGPFGRARFIDGSENRGGESTLGNLVAEVQRWATEKPESGSAQIAFMNPGGLRQDMLGTGTGAFPRTLTFKQAADVQPFANTLVNMQLTGAQIKSVLEEQWQPAGASRPFLRLGASKGFTYTYDPSKPAGSRITRMWLNGTPIQPGTGYSVTANSFLAAGGDNFLTFAQGTQKRDTGKVDLQAMVDYMAEFANTGAGDPPLPISYAQQAVGVKLPGAAPASYAAGDHVTFDLTSLVMTENNAVRDTQVSVRLGGTTLGTFPVSTVLSPPGNASSNDEVGTASVDVVIPAGTAPGATQLVVEGASGTSAIVPVTVSGGTTPPPPAPTPAPTTVAGAVKTFPYGEAGLLTIAVSRSDANGSADVFDESGAKLGTATIVAGRGSLTLAAKSMLPGTHVLTVKYLGTNEFAPSQTTVTFKVRKATPKVKLKVADEVSKTGGDKVVVRVTAANGVPVRGKVKLTIMGTGKEITVKLVKGKATFELPKVSTAGTYTLRARYLGSSLLSKAADRQKVDFVQ